MKIALAQINPTVGEVEHNYHLICKSISDAKQKKAELVVFPELCLTGYPPKDLLMKKKFVARNLEMIQRIVTESKDSEVALIIGFVDLQDDQLYNAAAIIDQGKLLGVYHKIHLPNYDVFDERRYFKPGTETKLVSLRGKKIGITICEDIWIDQGPVTELARQGAEIIINISASPFHAGKDSVREELLSRRAKENNISVLYVNLVGAQDDLIFDGRSYFFNQQGKMLIKAKAFEEEIVTLPELNSNHNNNQHLESNQNITKDIYDALVLGVKDYFKKNGFKKAILGLSGGIDSALTAAIAVDALGKENVLGLTMPSKFSSSGSISDSENLARNLGITIHTVAIKEVYNSILQTLEPQFKGTAFNVAEENIQARIRGNLLMAMSNKFNYLVLTTGNKSELSVGYATLYGDMCGGLAVISDLFKTTVYELSEYVNAKAGKEIIPKVVITKEPSAELREGQKDSDSLPIYAVLDPILKAYVEDEKSKDEITDLGFDKEVVSKVIRLVDRNEYKRQQAALGLRITPRAFGSGRRMPITNGWKE